jgi:SAM-dependent methyltransferase
LKDIFQGLTLEVEDLFLLEAFQIGKLPQYAPKRELAAVLHSHHALRRFLITKNPVISLFITEIVNDHGPARDQEQLNEFVDRVVWDHAIGQWLIANKHPEETDLRGRAGYWSLDEITSITSLNEKVVIDVGAGTGNIAFTVVEQSGVVFAVEPVTSLREFMRNKAKRNGIANLFVMDGLSHEIPLPRDSVDVLITSNVIGLGDLDEELVEIERVVKSEGYAIHLIRHPSKSKVEPIHQTLTSSKWNYQFEEVNLAAYKLNGGIKIKYWKIIA